MIGLTGPIGGGKSTALELLARVGAETLSADRVVHALYERADIQSAVRSRFGSAVFSADGSVDRAALATVVFRDAAALRALEALTHPPAREAFTAWVEASKDAALLVHEVPLLFEGGLEGCYDRTLVVTASPEVRAARIATRADSRDLAAREAQQLSSEEKASRADDVIVNDGSVAELREAVAEYVDFVLGSGGY